MKSVGENLRNRIQDIAVIASNNTLRDSIGEDPESTTEKASAFVKQASMHIYDLAPSLFESAVKHPYVRAGHQVIGLGYHSIVLKDGEAAVQKIYRSTLDNTEQEQIDYMASLNAKQLLLLKHFEDCTKEQTFTIDQHPLHPDRSVVIGRQALVRYQAPIDFTKPADASTHEIKMFIGRIDEMLAESAAMPDIVGTNNIVFTGSRASDIAIIDTIPLVETDACDAKTFGHGMQLLQSMRQALYKK